MTDQTISNQFTFGNQEDQRAADRAARAECLTSLGYVLNTETGRWHLKPKEPQLRSIPPDTSRQSLCLPGEDYTESVCLLLPDGRATLIDVRMYEWAISFDWQVLGRSVFYIERTPVTYIRRRCGIGRTGYGKFRIPSKTTMVGFTREIFEAGFIDDSERSDAVHRMQGKHIDHRNRRPWDHRWANLRIATASQNAHNTGPRKNKSSKYKGVSRVKGRERWVAKVRLKGRYHHLGTFTTDFDAARAYNTFVLKHIPEFGYINPLSISYEDEKTKG